MRIGCRQTLTALGHLLVELGGFHSRGRRLTLNYDRHRTLDRCAIAGTAERWQMSFVAALIALFGTDALIFSGATATALPLIQPASMGRFSLLRARKHQAYPRCWRFGLAIKMEPNTIMRFVAKEHGAENLQSVLGRLEAAAQLLRYSWFPKSTSTGPRGCGGVLELARSLQQLGSG